MISSYNTPYKFNGKELDEETGYYYYGARYYDPRTSIWLSVDPLTEKMPGWSPYNYTFQNPINLTDPTGMEPEGDGNDPPKSGIYIDHDNQTITYQLNLYFKSEEDLGLNKDAIEAWTNKEGTYTTKEGLEYSLKINIDTKISDNDFKHTSLSKSEDIKNDGHGATVEERGVQEYKRLIRYWKILQSQGIVNGLNEDHIDTGGGLTIADQKVNNRLSVANTQSRSHEIGYVLGLDDNSGGVMDYTESFSEMEHVTNSNFLDVFSSFHKKARKRYKRKPNKFNTTGKLGKYKIKGTYKGSGNFLDKRGKFKIKKNK